MSEKSKTTCPITCTLMAGCCKIWRVLSCPFAVMMGLVLISFTALAAAFFSEGFLGLEPCVLCIYQRWPYAIVMAIGLVTLIAKKKIGFMIGLAASALAFAVNSAIAVYHTGVEQKWWASEVEGCTVSFETDLETAAPATPQTLLENIMSAPTADCSKIPWQDPILNLSMANYNAMLCAGLAVICVIALVKAVKSSKTCRIN